MQSTKVIAESLARFKSAANKQCRIDRPAGELILFWGMPFPINVRGNDLNVEVLFNDHLVVAAGIHSRWARRRKIDLAELVDEPWLLAPLNNWNYSGTEDASERRGLACRGLRYLRSQCLCGPICLPTAHTLRRRQFLQFISAQIGPR
jgi:DNA-binding transcriptional LysR family regulator